MIGFDFRKRLRTSIFFKLLLVLIVVGILIQVAFVTTMSFAFRPNFGRGMRHYMERSARHFVDDLKNPLDFKEVKQLAEELDIGIRIEGAGVSWASADGVPKFVDLPGARPPGPGRMGSNFGFATVVERDSSLGRVKVIVTAPRRPEMEADYRVFVVFLLVVTLILVASYSVIRKILRPLSDLGDGVRAISSGNLQYKVSVGTTDELGRLGTAFNYMVTQVREMLQSKEQLLLDVSHELRSPLTRAKLGLELMKQTKGVGHVTEELNELDRMIEELLLAARLSSGKELQVETFDLVELLKGLVKQYREVGKRVSLSEAPGPILVNMDPLKITSVLRNLFDNALKYSPSESAVMVRVIHRGDWAGFEIEDCGSGIPPEELKSVFEPFYRVDKSRNRQTGGFGLGLSLCKRIVEAHHGQIRLASEEGKGTLATVLIPV